jgi:hypothetical protein
VAALWHLAVRSRHSLVHLPLRTDAAALAHSAQWWEGRSLDLLLLHHSFQVAPSRWKDIRRKLDRGRPARADSGVDPQAEFRARIGKPWLPHDSADVPDLTDSADTVVATGSTAALRIGAVPFMQLASCGPVGLRKGGYEY